MRQQVLAIIWAQFRITRNHLPRTGVAGVAMWIVSALWYALFVFLAGLAVTAIPGLPYDQLVQALPILLLAVFLYTQIIPLFTLSTGWSLQTNKLQVYPIPNSGLFSLEVLLRITSAPEFIVVLIGITIGVALRHDVTLWAALSLLLFIPFNLFLQLAARELVTKIFARGRFREILTIVLVCIGVVPQILVRTPLGPKLKPYFLFLSQGQGTPWSAAASLALNRTFAVNLLFMALWTLAALWISRKLFDRGLLQDDAFSSGGTSRPKSSFASLDFVSSLFKDPTSAILQKEFRSLLRMPRFRVVLGMACVLSALVFLPMRISPGNGDGSFFADNYFTAVNIYGLMILADALMLNIFGTDRAATQLYYLTPARFKDVVIAKNLAVCPFILLQNVIVAVLTALLTHVSPIAILAGFLASAAATVHLMWAGNLLSVILPRPIDPASTMKKQANTKVQLWNLLCSLGMAVIIGFGVLARWAFHSDWALIAVLLFEFGIGLVMYRVALDSVIERGVANREHILDLLSKSSSPVAGSLGL